MDDRREQKARNCVPRVKDFTIDLKVAAKLLPTTRLVSAAVPFGIFRVKPYEGVHGEIHNGGQNTERKDLLNTAALTGGHDVI